MGTTNTITKLEQNLKDEYKLSLKDHKKIVAKYKQGKELIKQMPEELANMDWYFFRKLDSTKWYLETTVLSEEEANQVMDNLRPMGVIALPSNHNEWNDRWQYTGYLILDGLELVIKIDGGSKPPDCRIEEIRKMEEVITYKAHCPDFTN